MVEQPIEVDVHIGGQDLPAGRLWTHHHGQRESATFSYREDYLQRADAYELDPGLPLQSGQHQTALGQALFGAMSDCAPDGWGRRLVRRVEAQRAREAARHNVASLRSTSYSAHATTYVKARCGFARAAASNTSQSTPREFRI